MLRGFGLGVLKNNLANSIGGFSAVLKTKAQQNTLMLSQVEQTDKRRHIKR